MAEEGKRKHAGSFRIVGILFLLALVSFGAVWYANSRVRQKPQRGMFEWNDRTVKEVSAALELAKTLQIDRWYQEISDETDDITPEELADFVRAMHEHGIRVYLLVGAVDWGFEEDGASLKNHLEELFAWQEGAGEEERIDGVMLDIEPYITKEWKQDPETFMDAYVSGMKQAYEFVKSQGLRTVICIPRHYDSQGLETGLEELIAHACDEVAVMNYGCGDETEQIETEERLARRYNKELHCILEFQEVGKHGLTEEETYRNKGLKAAEAVWDEMQKKYRKTSIIRDYHCAAVLKKMCAETEAETAAE